jgi:hypothetical protein
MTDLPRTVAEKVDKFNVCEAYSVLSALGEPGVSVYFNQKSYRVKDLAHSDEYAWLPANKVNPLFFWGGPPTQLRWYAGSLSTLVADRVKDYLCRHSVRHLLNHLNLTG